MTKKELYHYTPGRVPLLVNMPHTATHVPPDILNRLTPEAKKLPDTDWHIDRLYAFARELGAHLLMPTHSRYVVDLNRAPDNESLYPGQFTTGTCPTTLFNGDPLYLPGKEPDAAEIRQRVADYWQPYHNKIQSIIDELKSRHQKVVVFDAHSICSQVPALFDGVLPDLNIGTDNGKTADIGLCEEFIACGNASPYSTVYNGRFKGGYITRHYGKPAENVHAIQLELAQKNYMQETCPFAYDDTKAKELQKTLKTLIMRLIEWVQ